MPIYTIDVHLVIRFEMRMSTWTIYIHLDIRYNDLLKKGRNESIPMSISTIDVHLYIRCNDLQQKCECRPGQSAFISTFVIKPYLRKVIMKT